MIGNTMGVLSVLSFDFRLLMEKVRNREYESSMTDNAKRDTIKKAAKDLFFRLGMTKTSMADIAMHSGLAKPTLYYYYENKEALFEEIVVEEAKSFLDHIEMELTEAEPGPEKVILFFQKIYQGLILQNERIAGIPEVMCNHMPHGRPVVEKIWEIMIDILENILHEGKKTGALSIESEQVTAQSLMLMMMFMNLEWIKNTHDEERNRISREVMRILMNGLNGRNDNV
jgi:AcrR family transcriptional regulator